MNVHVTTAVTNTSCTRQIKTSGGYMFAQVMQQMYSTQITAVSDVAAQRAAAVRGELDAQTLAHLDKYAEIYNKYADRYGDGFELQGRNYTQGDTEGEAAYKKYSAIREEFNAELSAAGIPGIHGQRLTAEHFLNGGVNISEIKAADYGGSISALFYAEKYGLAGLSPEEQCTEALGSVQISSYRVLNITIGLLYHVGALSGDEYRSIDNSSFNLAVSDLGNGYTNADLTDALNGAKDWSALLEELEGEDGVYALLSKAWAEQEADDEAFQAILRKVDAYQEAIRESIELRNQKRRDQELLDRAAAESMRLRVVFGLTEWADAVVSDMNPEPAVL